jgi:hypothetical protein
MTRIRSLVCLSAFLAACAGDPLGLEQGLDPEDLDVGIDGKAEAWDRANNPAYVDDSFLYNVNQLPLRGENPKPIPSDYWAVHKDSLNVIWDGGMSPAEKYARAFGKPVRDIQEAVSRANGVKAHPGRRTCQTSADCASLEDGSACATSYDGSEKRCIPTWFGICHGWAIYALREPQAREPVTRTAPDGATITFYASDLEALMSLLYTRINSKFLSSRCDRGTGPGDTIVTDNGGRITHAECRDMNPGSWHVLATNMLGLRRTGFVLDQTMNFEVWNQPSWRYQIVNAQGGQLREVSRREALALLGQPDGAYGYNPSAKKFFHVEMDFTFVVESEPGRTPRDAADYAVTKRYKYILETDDNGKILGGEWVGTSREDHPDFAWWSTGTPTGDVAGVRYADVKALNDQAAGPPAVSDRETLLDAFKLPHTFWTKSTYVALNLAPGYRKVTMRMTGSGAARLMVGPKGKNPRIGWGSWNLCDADVAGTANQTCTFDVDPAGGVYYVRARSEAEGTVVTLVAEKLR